MTPLAHICTYLRHQASIKYLDNLYSELLQSTASYRDCPRIGTLIALWCFLLWFDTLQWRHDERDDVSNHQPHDLLNRLFKARIKENIKALRYWPLWGEFTGDRWIPRTKGQQREKCFRLMTSSWQIGLHTILKVALLALEQSHWSMNRKPVTTWEIYTCPVTLDISWSPIEYQWDSRKYPG